MDIIDFVTNKVQDIIKGTDIRLFNVEYEKKDDGNVIRVIVDKPSLLEIDDCIFISEKLSPILEEEDPIEEDYFLEVTSPGAEREVSLDEDLDFYLGRYMSFKTYEQEYIGTFLEIKDGQIILKVNNKGRIKNIELPACDIQAIMTKVKI